MWHGDVQSSRSNIIFSVIALPILTTAATFEMTRVRAKNLVVVVATSALLKSFIAFHQREGESLEALTFFSKRLIHSPLCKYQASKKRTSVFVKDYHPRDSRGPSFDAADFGNFRIWAMGEINLFSEEIGLTRSITVYECKKRQKFTDVWGGGASVNFPP